MTEEFMKVEIPGYVENEAGEKIDQVLALVRAEVVKAIWKFDPINSPHEGYAVILEELDELWTHVKANTGRTPEAFKEAVQIAAMGVRYLYDLQAP